MSGSSANAAARRRRAAPEAPTPTTNVNPNVNPNPSVTPVPTANMSQPLQLLYVHEERFNDLEENLENTVIEIINKRMAEQNLNEKLKFLSDKLNLLTNDFNNIKDLVIKSQTLGLETNTEMLKMKDAINDLDSKIKEAANDEDENMFSDSAAKMLFKSMFEGGMPNNMEELNKMNVDEFNTLNIHDKVEDDDLEVEAGSINQLSVTSEEIEDRPINELVMDKEEIGKLVMEELKDDRKDLEANVIDELKEKITGVEVNNIDELSKTELEKVREEVLGEILEEMKEGNNIPLIEEPVSNVESK